MKKWLFSFKFIIIILLFLIFAFYYYTTKIKSKDGFQNINKNDNDYHYPHFDISANYYNLTEPEKAMMKKIDPDSVILNIGNTLSEGIDTNNIPWDSENRGLTPSKILWGVVSRETSASIYNKIFIAEQLAKIRAAEDSKFYYETAILHFGTADPNLGEAMKVADFIANFTGPLVVPMLGEKMGGGADTPLFEKEVYTSPNTNQTDTAKNMTGVIDTNTETFEVDKSMSLKHARTGSATKNKPRSTDPNIPNAEIPDNPIDNISQQKSYKVKFKSSRLLGKLITLYFDWIELIPPPVGPIMNGIYMIVIMPIVMGIALPVISPKKGSIARIEALTANVYASLASMSATALVSMLQPMNMLAQAATLAAALYGALAAYFQQIEAVPAGYRSLMEKMIQQTGHGSGDGKCPNGYVPLDQVWNATTELFISFVPIFGDLIDLLYPYLCVRSNATAINDRGDAFSQLVCIRDPYVIPKYMEQSWISSMFLDWPDYNNKLSTGVNMVGGKLRIVPPQGSPYWSWSGFTNFNDIKNNPNNYYNLNVNLENFQRKTSYEYIGFTRRKKDSPDPDPTFRFFYLDFSDPNILIEMAQFYYNYAIRNAQIGDDRTFTIEYIAKINYVTSSSLFSCDAMCEMISVQYDARSGKFIKETRTYDSDRRFYFRWRPANGVSGACMPVSDIWGNHATLDAVWRQLDDAYDEAMHQLNDAIHFPTDPTEDPTGLISGDVLLTGYELYLEQKERSKAAADYIVAMNPTFRYTIPETATTQTLSQLRETYNTALTTVIYTTAQRANDESVTLPSNIDILTNAENNYENALLEADPFYLDFKIISDTARDNYIFLLNQLYTINEDPEIFYKNDLTFRYNIANDLQPRMNAVIAAREALWNKHKKDSSTSPTSNDINNLQYKYGNHTFMNSKYYDVTGCTHIDETAPAAVTPDVTSLQSDIRFPSKFDVLPHLKRCENINITLDKCIDLSNIEQVIQAVERENPNLRIKSIHSIKARGNNTCQYIWDEYNKATPATITRTTNRILYQQDISACTFCLPEVGTPKVQKIYIDNNDNKADVFNIVPRRYQDGVTPIPDSIDKYESKYVEGPTNITKTLDTSTVVPATGVNHYFQPLDNYRNTNGRLAFKKANYRDPKPLAGGGVPVETIQRTNELYVPRYDINNNYNKLPDLVRPKKPIRISYPNALESSLGPTTATNFSNYCSDPVNMSNFMLYYNRTNPNPKEMIVNIQRAFTTSPTTCDYEIDVFIKNPVEKDMYDNEILSGGITKPLLETSITQILKIDENGTQIKVTSAKEFTKYMNLIISYTITNTINYTLTTGLFIGVGKITTNIFNPYERTLRTRLTTSGATGYVGANNTIIGFDLHNYKLTVNATNNPTNITFIVSVKLYNTISKLTTTKVVKFSITSFSYSGGIITYNTSDSTIDAELGPTVTYTISSCDLYDDLTAQLTALGTLITVTDTTPYDLLRVISINSDALTAYNSVSTRRSVSQAIQGLRVISSVDVTNNTITYFNDQEKMPLDIDYYLGNTRTPNIRNIPATATNIGKITLENIVTRKTVSYNMTSSPPLTEPYVNTPFTYQSIRSEGDGLEIKKYTSTLNGPYSNSGYNFSIPAKSNIDSKFGPNTSYFNDNLVTLYTSNVSTLSGKTSDFLRPLVQAIKLSNIVGGTNVCATQASATNPTNVCSNTNYMQRIMDSYNNANSPIGIFNQERNTMTKIIQSSTADGSNCHLIFENKNERFNNITTYDSNNPNNYTVTNTLKFMRFPMDSNATTCDFTPKKIPVDSVISNNSLSTYPAIRASDLTLSYSDNFSPPYVKSLKTAICQVGDTASLYDALIENYSNRVNSTNLSINPQGLTNPLRFTTIEKIVPRIIGYDKIDYLLGQSNNLNPDSIQRVILRAKFDLASYPTDCSWSYTADSFKVQIALKDTITGADRLKFTSQSFVDVIDVDFVTGETDNISPLIFYPEFNTLAS